MSQRGRCEILIENLVEILDLCSEGRVAAYEEEQLGVFMLWVDDATIEEYITRHLSYTIIINLQRNTIVVCGSSVQTSDSKLLIWLLI